VVTDASTVNNAEYQHDFVNHGDASNVGQEKQPLMTAATIADYKIVSAVESLG